MKRHASPLGSWEIAEALPAPHLRPWIRRYTGWFEHMAAPLCRREIAGNEAPLIISFGSPVRLHDAGDTASYTNTWHFVTGAYDRCQVVGSAGPTGGVQVGFTLLGMRLLAGRPIEEMTNRAVTLEDVLGAAGRELPSRLYEAPTWEARFATLEAVLSPRLLGASAPPAGVLCAWHRLVTSGGRAAIRDIVAEVGWSQKHLTAQFRHHVGLAPKVFARILRFERAVRAIRTGAPIALAELAASCGYYDQSHLHRDCREFAGVTPGELVGSRLPDGGGFADDAVQSRRAIARDSDR